MYENIDDGAFIGGKQYYVLMFKVNFLGLGLLCSSLLFIYFFNIYTYNLKQNASLTHVMKGLGLCLSFSSIYRRPKSKIYSSIYDPITEQCSSLD